MCCFVINWIKKVKTEKEKEKKKRKKGIYSDFSSTAYKTTLGTKIKMDLKSDQSL